MEHTRGKALEQLELIAWDDAALQVGGGASPRPATATGAPTRRQACWARPRWRHPPTQHPGGPARGARPYCQLARRPAPAAIVRPPRCSLLQCGGGDARDDAFLAELLVTYYEDGLPRLKRLLQAALAFRAGEATLRDAAAPSGGGARALEQVIKDEAHALKGSAANVRLWRLAKVR